MDAVYTDRQHPFCVETVKFLRKKRGAGKLKRHGERAAYDRKRDKTRERTYA